MSDFCTMAEIARTLPQAQRRASPGPNALTAEALRANLAKPLPRGLIVDLQPAYRSGWVARILAPIAKRRTFRFPFQSIRAGLWQHRQAELPRGEDYASRLSAGVALQDRLRAEQDEAADIRRTSLRNRFLRHHWRENGTSARIAEGLRKAMAETETFLAKRHRLILARAA